MMPNSRLPPYLYGSERRLTVVIVAGLTGRVVGLHEALVLDTIRENIRRDDVDDVLDCTCSKSQMVQKRSDWGRFKRIENGKTLLVVVSHEHEEKRILIRSSRTWQLADCKAWQ